MHHVSAHGSGSVHTPGGANGPPRSRRQKLVSCTRPAFRSSPSRRTAVMHRANLPAGRDHSHHRTSALPQAPRRPRTGRRLFDEVIHADEPFSSRHRIMETDHRIHHEIVVGIECSTRTIRSSAPPGTTSTSPKRRKQTSASSTRHTPRPSPNSNIPGGDEQAKGAVMLVYGVSTERAFGILTWRSQQTNTKLHTLAERLRRHPHRRGDPARVVSGHGSTTSSSPHTSTTTHRRKNGTDRRPRTVETHGGTRTSASRGKPSRCTHRTTGSGSSPIKAPGSRPSHQPDQRHVDHRRSGIRFYEMLFGGGPSIRQRSSGS